MAQIASRKVFVNWHPSSPRSDQWRAAELALSKHETQGRGLRVGYGVVEAVVVASFVGMTDGLASMITVRVPAAVLPQVSVAT